MTHRRRHRKPCPTSGKVRMRDEAACHWLGERVLRARYTNGTARWRIAEALWVYRCPSCRDWHLTSQDQGDGARVKDPGPGTGGTIDLAELADD